MTLSAWADLSIILLAIEAFVICLVLGVIYFYATRGILQLMRRLRITFPIIQGYFRQAEQVTKTASDRVAAPFIATSAATAKVRRWQHSIKLSLRPTKEV